MGLPASRRDDARLPERADHAQPNPRPNATSPYVIIDDNGLPVAGDTPSTASAPSVVVITSKVMGHLGGNSLTARLLAPTGPNQALSVTFTGNALRVNLASNAEGAVTSTANQVIAAINAHPDANRVVRATKYRTSTGEGIVAPGVTSPLSDLLRAPAFVPRGPLTQPLLRIGKVRDGSKVGVYLYCQEHAGEIATSGVCLETAERLVRNYGTDPKTTELVDNLEIFLVPQINGDGVIHSIYDSPRRTNMAPYCYDPSNTENLGDPANRNNYGVNINRNFSIGSFFDGFVGAELELLRRQHGRPVRALRAGDAQRDLRSEQVHEHQVLEQHPLVRWLLHVAARRLQADS